MATVIYKGQTFYHVGKVTLRAGVNKVTKEEMDYLMSNPHFRHRINLGIIVLPEVPSLTGKDLTKSISEAVNVIARMNDYKVLKSIAQYDSRIEVMRAAEERVRQLEERARSSDISQKHFKGIE